MVLQTPDLRSSRRWSRLGAMGPESGSGRRTEPSACADRERGQDMGRHGYAKSTEGQAGELQDTAGAKGGGRITQKCHGQGYVYLLTLFASPL